MRPGNASTVCHTLCAHFRQEFDAYVAYALAMRFVEPVPMLSPPCLAMLTGPVADALCDLPATALLALPDRVGFLHRRYIVSLVTVPGKDAGKHTLSYNAPWSNHATAHTTLIKGFADRIACEHAVVAEHVHDVIMMC